MNNYQIFVDMDGVLVSFLEAAQNYLDTVEDVENEPEAKEIFWGEVENWTESFVRDFWATLPVAPNALELWHFVSKFNASILSSPAAGLNIPILRNSTKNAVRLGKIDWIATYLNPAPYCILFEEHKQIFARPNYILIDDKPRQIENWEREGGIGILYSAHGHSLGDLFEKLMDLLYGESNEQVA